MLHEPHEDMCEADLMVPWLRKDQVWDKILLMIVWYIKIRRLWHNQEELKQDLSLGFLSLRFIWMEQFGIHCLLLYRNHKHEAFGSKD
jgi:hypothetical protein